MWTNYDIVTFFYRALKESELAQSVNGTLSRRGRPANSKVEDIIVTRAVISGCGQVQRAYINVNIYVQGKYNSETKEYEEPTKRIGELSKLCKFLFNLHGDGLKVKSSECSQNVEEVQVTTEDGLTEWYVNNRIYLEINNE